MTAVMFLVIPIYENYKFNGSGKFPDSLYSVNLPFYIFLWIAGLFFTNNYSKPFPKLTSLFYGMLLGTLSISVVYAFLGEDLRASRALIIIGGVFNFIVLFFVRWLWQIIKFKRVNLYNKSVHGIITVGDSSDVQDLNSLLNKNTDSFVIRGYAGTKQEEELKENFLGHYNRLSQILNLYPTEELIFVTEKVSWKEVISTMENYRQKYTYKFFNNKAYFALGSNSKNAAGEVFTNAVNFSLNRSEMRYNKRFSDIVISMLLLPFSLLLFIWVKKKGNFFRNIFRVLGGKKTWVAYAHQGIPELPKIKTGVLLTVYDDNIEKGMQADIEYARNYSSLKDVILFVKNIPHLGD
jgi:hypothetical protein